MILMMDPLKDFVLVVSMVSLMVSMKDTMMDVLMAAMKDTMMALSMASLTIAM